MIDISSIGTQQIRANCYRAFHFADQAQDHNALLKSMHILGECIHLRGIIEAGPPEGILSRFNDMFEEKEKATHIRAAEVMRELGWDATD